MRIWIRHLYNVVLYFDYYQLIIIQDICYTLGYINMINSEKVRYYLVSIFSFSTINKLMVCKTYHFGYMTQGMIDSAIMLGGIGLLLNIPISPLFGWQFWRRE